MEITEMTEIRRKNLATLIQEKFQGNRAAFCRATGRNPNLINLILSNNPEIRRNLGEKLARGIEEQMGLAEGWLDVNREGGPVGQVYTFPVTRLDDLDTAGIEKIVLGQDVAARHFDRPTAMASVRACYMVGTEMEPAISQGDIMLVDTGCQELEKDGVYVITRGRDVFVRRVRKTLDGSIRISADNDPEGVVQAQPGRFKSAGRIVGLMRFSRP